MLQAFASLPPHYYPLAAIIAILLLEALMRGYRFAATWFKRSLSPALKRTGSYDSMPPTVSIIMPIRDSDNYEETIRAILKQEYPQEFNLIVVNDSGDPETTTYLERIRAQLNSPKLYITTVPPTRQNGLPSRKLALSIGIKAATNEFILVTQANACPASPRWIEAMMKNVQHSTDLVLGPTITNKPHTHSFFSLFLQAHSLFRTAARLSYANNTRIALAYRANFAFRRECYFKNGGIFSGINHIASGDDDLLAIRIANRHNVAVTTAQNALILQQAPDSYQAFRRQYYNRTQSLHFYPKPFRIRLLADAWMHTILFTAAFITMLAYHEHAPTLLIAAAIPTARFIALHLAMNQVRKRFAVKTIWYTKWYHHLLQDFIYDTLWPLITISIKKKKASR